MFADVVAEDRPFTATEQRQLGCLNFTEAHHFLPLESSRCFARQYHLQVPPHLLGLARHHYTTAH